MRESSGECDTTERKTKTEGKFMVLYTNADQFLNKKDKLLQLIAGNEPNIMIITEVIPKAQINPIEAPLLEIEGCDHYLNFEISNMNLGASGIRGVAIYVKEDLHVNEVTFDTDFMDHLWVEISLTDGKSLLCGCIYSSPTKEKAATVNSTNKVCDLLLKTVERENTYLLICGDFNYREVDWENESLEERHGHLSSFIATIQECFLHQHVTELTRFRFGKEPSLLDLVLSNEEGMVYNLAYHPGLGDSDHIILTFDLVCYNDQANKPLSQPDFFKANYAAIRFKLKSIDWAETLIGNFINSYEEFMRILTTSMEGNVPKRNKRSKKRNIYMNNEATRLKNKKQKLWKKYVASKSAEDHENFDKCKNNLRCLTRTLRKDFEKAQAIKIKNNPQPFWSYVQSKLKTKVKIPTLPKLDGTKAYNSKEKAEALNE